MLGVKPILSINSIYDESKNLIKNYIYQISYLEE
jgi:hypothetical protein